MPEQLSYNYEACWMPEGTIMKSRWEENCYTIMQEGHLRYILEKFHNKDRAIPNILEMGAGFGRITDIILNNWKVGAYDAVDISMDQLKHIRHSHPDVHCVRQDITKLEEGKPFKHYNLVICAEFLMHIKPEHIEQVLKVAKAAGNKHYLFLEYYPIDEVKRPLSVHNFAHDYPALLEKVFGHKFNFHRIYEYQGIFYR